MLLLQSVSWPRCVTELPGSNVDVGVPCMKSGIYAAKASLIMFRMLGFTSGTNMRQISQGSIVKIGNMNVNVHSWHHEADAALRV